MGDRQICGHVLDQESGIEAKLVAVKTADGEIYRVDFFELFVWRGSHVFLNFNDALEVCLAGVGTVDEVAA